MKRNKYCPYCEREPGREGCRVCALLDRQREDMEKEIVEKIESIAGITSTQWVPVLGDGKGDSKQIMFFNLDDWIKFTQSLESFEGSAGKEEKG